MFDIQHHDNPLSRNQTLRDLVRILLATVTPRPRLTNGFDSIYTWGGSAPGRTSSMEFGGPVRSGPGRFGSCLHYEIIQTSSSWINPER